MLILEIFKNEEIRNHHSRNFNSSYFMGHTMDISWLSNWKLKLAFLIPYHRYYINFRKSDN